jgi:KaiC/GvpD/RAD55 family RecA-like ATPase
MTRILTTSQLDEIPEPQYLLWPFLVDGGLSVLFGPSGTFKSFVALDWALRIAADKSSVYVAAEGASSLRRRVAAWRANGPDADLHAAWITTPVNLLDKSEVNDLEASIDALGWNPAVLVFDTLARCAAGGDENSAQDMGRVIASVDRLRDRFACAALLIHHTGKTDLENERGSSALRGAADITIRAKASGKLRVKLECAKVRDAAEFDPMLVQMVQVDGSLVAGTPGSPDDVLDRAVRRYLSEHPDASQRQVEENVTGRAEDIRAIVKRVRPTRPDLGRTPGQGASRVPSLEGRGDADPIDEQMEVGQ